MKARYPAKASYTIVLNPGVPPERFVGWGVLSPRRVSPVLEGP
jgi:hypothetical protein